MSHGGAGGWVGLAGTAFVRWTLAIAAGFTTMALLLFAFIYWQTAIREQARIDTAILRESHVLLASARDRAGPGLEAWLASDPHGQLYGGLFDTEGHRMAGNLLAVPAGLPADGLPHRAMFGPIGREHDGNDPEAVRGLATRLPDGHLLVLGYDVDELKEVDDLIGRALVLGLVPMILLSLAGGMLLARRAQRRIGTVHQAVNRIMAGALQERLPILGTGDELDKVSAAVNRMLDQMERLVEDLRAVGDNIAHDLRTPLTHVRMRLERSRDEAQTVDEFRLASDRTIAAVDAALAVVGAILRIGEMEHGPRRAAFAPMDLAGIVAETVELYEPIAEDRGIRLTLALTAHPTVMGDRDLMVEAVGNLLDNAVKFAPPGSVVTVALDQSGSVAMLRVADRGPGIPSAERDRVLQRFYRMEKSRTVDGSGLGLSLVAAIMTLHGFMLRIGDADPGCVVQITCPDVLPGAVTETVSDATKTEFSLAGQVPGL